jgi:hypothetical protein
MRFFIDHCVPRSIVSRLREAGRETLLLGDFLPTDALGCV